MVGRVPADPGAIPVDASFLDALERLFARFEGRHTLPVISAVTVQARADLREHLHPEAQAEFLERLAAERLDVLPATRPRGVTAPPERTGENRPDDLVGLTVAVEAPSPAADTVVTVVGELDLATAPRLADVLSDQLRHRARATVVDLSGLTFCDASGLSALVAACAAYRGAGVPFTIAGCSGALVRLLAITGLQRDLLQGLGGQHPVRRRR